MRGWGPQRLIAVNMMLRRCLTTCGKDLYQLVKRWSGDVERELLRERESGVAVWPLKVDRHGPDSLAISGGSCSTREAHRWWPGHPCLVALGALGGSDGTRWWPGDPRLLLGRDSSVEKEGGDQAI